RGVGGLPVVGEPDEGQPEVAGRDDVLRAVVAATAGVVDQPQHAVVAGHVGPVRQPVEGQVLRRRGTAELDRGGGDDGCVHAGQPLDGGRELVDVTRDVQHHQLVVVDGQVDAHGFAVGVRRRPAG